jgi:hypothetical protein
MMSKELILLTDSITPLKNYFDSNKTKLRFLALLSPT